MIPGPTLRDVLTEAVSRLEAAGVDSPSLDAQLLLAHVLGRDRTYLFAHLPDPLPPDAAAGFSALVDRRAAREPLPYLLGTWEFMGMPLRVTPSVLIPRPETEVLVEAAAARLPPDARVLDVGAGSGCISIGLAKLLPGADILALEPSQEAAEVARLNIATLGVAERVRILPGRFPDDARHLRDLDAIVSNPPYIPTPEVDGLAPELRLHEPRLALDGGPDGLAVLGPLVSETPPLLRPGGLLAVEVAMGQAERVAELIRASGRFESPEVIPDLAGTRRVVLTRRR